MNRLIINLTLMYKDKNTLDSEEEKRFFFSPFVPWENSSNIFKYVWRYEQSKHSERCCVTVWCSSAKVLYSSLHGCFDGYAPSLGWCVCVMPFEGEGTWRSEEGDEPVSNVKASFGMRRLHYLFGPQSTGPSLPFDNTGPTHKTGLVS